MAAISTIVGGIVAGGVMTGGEVDAASKKEGSAQETEAEKTAAISGDPSSVADIIAATKAREDAIAAGASPEDAQAAFDDSLADASGGAQRETEKAFDQAQDQIREGTTQAEEALRTGTTQAAGAITDAATAQEQAVRDAAAQAQTTLTGAGQVAREDVQGGLADSTGTLRAGEQQAAGALQQGLAGAEAALDPALQLQGFAQGATEAIDPFDVTGARSRRGELLDQEGGLFAGFEADPGFKFRQEQGEQAIGRAASARGGRLSGRSLKELSKFNSGLASQEFQNFAARRQAEAGIAGGVDQQTLSALLNQAGRTDAANQQAKQNQLGLAGIGFGAGSQLAGFNQQFGGNLANLFSGTAGQIGSNQFGAGGLLAQFGLGTGQGVAGLQSGLGGQLSGVFGQQGANLANLFSGQGGNLAGLFGAQGSQLAGLSTQGSDAQNQLLQLLLGNIGSADKFAGATSQSVADLAKFGIQTGTQVAGSVAEAGGKAAGGGA